MKEDNNNLEVNHNNLENNINLASLNHLNKNEQITYMIQMKHYPKKLLIQFL